MTVLEMAQQVGKDATWLVEGIRVPVHISDVRKVFSRVDFLCTPIGGEGSKWISEDRIKL